MSRQKDAVWPATSTRRREVDTGGPDQSWLASVQTSWSWLPNSDQPRALRVDEPEDGQSVGGLVIVPAIGRERVVSYRSLRALAIRAAQAGFVVASVDLRGQGDSPPLLEDGDLASCWRSDVAAVVDFTRTLTVGPVHVIGLRVTAGLAGEVPAGPGEVRMLWEPIAGTAWMRQLRTLRKFALAQPVVDDGVELHEMHLRTGEASSLRSITLPDETDLQPGIVVRRESDRAVAERLVTGNPHQSRIPHAVLDEVVAALPRGATSAIRSWHPRSSYPTMDGVTETHIQVDGRHGVLTEPTGSATITQAFAFTAIGSELSTGPGEMWARGARDLARAGAVALRVDRSELGDALDPIQVTEPLPYTDRAVSDVERQIDELRTRYPQADVIGIGACAGAWCFLRAASAGSLKRVLAINHIHWAPNESHYRRAFYVRAHGEEGRINLNSGPLASTGVQGSASGSVAQRWDALLNRLGMRYPRLAVHAHRTDYGDRVGRLLRPLPDRVAINLLLGEHEYGQFIGKGGRRYLHGRGRRFPLTLSVSKTLDHSLSSEGARREVLAVLDSLVHEVDERAR